ncbi:MAG: FAD-binding and (Fe-S)-binding domain-containing protein [Proteiniphilum sp.]|nr:FAD-binding and (Fe-S)-binding domain-containing protein [Proteiniphilum sp.]MDD4799521.1 FAD-binding and (Fe-S)-binding domain-containing protein [Proteiniphilum sp.]
MNATRPYKSLSQLFPAKQLYTDELSRLTKGTDASLYRLIPQAVVRVHNEEEVIRLLRFCHREKIAVTFKAAGTSLSGQAISDSLLMETGPGFECSAISDHGHTATFGCGVRGSVANSLLAPYARRLGPKPASINAAKIGGIIANNASGSSYGILHNSYHTVQSMRIILADGTLLDTADAGSRQAFMTSQRELCEALLRLRREATDNPKIRDRISRKFELKNTCGYGVNALIDFEDPVDILQHLMIGSEGTLGFVSQATFATVHDAPLKATALVYFASLRDVCDTILPLRSCRVYAAELMDRNALHAVENLEGMPAGLKELPKGAAALLIDTAADDPETLTLQIRDIEKKLAHIPTLAPIAFTTDIHLYNLYWNVRNGLFTSAAATRPPHTACIIEDVAFRGEILGDALEDLHSLLVRTGYEDAVMWGHLLDGNVHFTVFPDINTPEGVAHYARFMRELCGLVAVKHEGSLKAEHGTGRNMAPFVEKEWGSEIYDLMKRIKQVFDPQGVLNPGVVINDDPEVFIQNLKQFPEAHPLIDQCIECGFCEATCPSTNLTLTPRQRIVAYRYLAGKESETGGKNIAPAALRAISYPLEQTCATDGLCRIACPVGIDTGLLVKELRWQQQSSVANAIAGIIARHMGGVTALLRAVLPIPHVVARLTGYALQESIMRGLFRVGDGLFPLWTRHTPSGSKRITASRYPAPEADAPVVVYFPSCITRSMGGPSAGYKGAGDLPSTMLSVLRKAGYTVILPEEHEKLCCGMAFSSKGFRRQARMKEKELNEALLKASDNGAIPVVCDMSPCLLHMRETLDHRLKLYDQVSFIHDFLLERLQFVRLPLTIALHVTCSSTKMQLAEKFVTVASRCAEKVVVPENVHCCGWAGDRGFFYPELNRSALASLQQGIKDAQEGYSNSRTCEIGLSMHSGIIYQSVIYLVDKATTGPVHLI